MFTSLSLKAASCVSAVPKATFYARHSLQLVHYKNLLPVLRVPWRRKTTASTDTAINGAYGYLNGAAASLSARLKVPVDNILKVSLSSTQHGFDCKVTLFWPEREPVSFNSFHQKKKVARIQASSMAWMWLLDKKLLDFKRRPVIDSDRRKQEICPTIHLSETVCREIDEVLQTYKECVLPLMKPLYEEDGYKIPDAKYTSHPIFGPQIEWKREKFLGKMKRRRNNSFHSPNSFPVEKYRTELVEAIKNNRVVLVKGETGCGKSTQVPQFILDNARDQGHGSDCTIAVVQNRRMPCVALANYIANARGEKVGETVGYSIKMDTVHPFSDNGAIMFFTSGKILNILRQNPYLHGVSHIILDEVHTRDIMTDCIMCMMKRALKHNTKLHLILMSATVDESKSYSYFQDVSNVSVYTIPGRLFPVKQNFLDDFISEVKLSLPHKSAEQCLIKQPSGEMELNIDLTVETIRWIHKTRPEGSILVFVTGWKDVVKIEDKLKIDKELTVIPVHSRLGKNVGAFCRPLQGKRKVILATNIAETSLTFTDVVYVVDCGLQKVSVRDSGKAASSILKIEEIHKANAKQRMGRAGRVQPGESFHLYTRQHFEEMEDYDLPSIMRQPLEDVVFAVKLMSPTLKAVDVLKDFPDPPNEEDVKNSVEYLTNLNILACKDEVPTSVAEVLINISASIPNSLALMYSVLFRCMDLTLSVMTLQEQNTTLLDSFGVMRQFDKTSDIIAQGKFLDKCLEYLHQGYDAKEIASAYETDVSREDIFFSKNLRSHLRKQLLNLVGKEIDCNNSEELFKGILVACCGSLLAFNDNSKLRDEKGQRALISKGVNHKRRYSSPSFFIHYLYSNVSNGLLLVRDTTIISPLTFALFSQQHLITEEFHQYSILKMEMAEHFRVIVQKEDVQRLLDLRRALKDTAQYFMMAELLHREVNDFETVSKFREKLINCVIRMLQLEKINLDKLLQET